MSHKLTNKGNSETSHSGPRTVYAARADGTTADMLREAREACDPRVVPILVEVLDKLPAASGNRAYAFQETLMFYAAICPRTMQRELERRDLPNRLAAIPSHARSYLIRDAMEAANAWQPRDSADRQEDITRCVSLASRVRDGRGEETDALLQAADALMAKRGFSYPACQGFKALLDSGSAIARERYLEYVKTAKRGQINRFSHERSIGVDVTLLLHPLFPEQATFYFEQVRALLRSNSLIERKAGLESLAFTLKCDFGFDPEALEAERLRKLASVEPSFANLLSKTELEARTILLAHHGFVLDGEPGDAWLRTLQRAAASNNESAAGNALRLMEIFIGDLPLRRIENLPPRHRARAVEAYLQDAGRLSMAAPR